MLISTQSNWEFVILHENLICHLPWPGFEPGLLRPQRNVLTTIRSRRCEDVKSKIFHILVIKQKFAAFIWCMLTSEHSSLLASTFLRGLSVSIWHWSCQHKRSVFKSSLFHEMNSILDHIQLRCSIISFQFNQIFYGSLVCLLYIFCCCFCVGVSHSYSCMHARASVG